MNDISIQEKYIEKPEFFQSMLAHDIKTPINQVKGLLYVLKKQVAHDEEILKVLNLAIASNERLYSTVENLLKSSSLHEKPKELINFSEILKDVEGYFSTIADDDKIRLIKNIDQDICYFGDAILIKSVIQNLIENAIKYRGSKSKECLIIFSVQQIPDNIIIKISDNGMGICKEKLPYIFERNYRATEEKNGSGVGLYLVKESLAELNANISVSSKVGSGTTFTVTLPHTSLKLAN